MEIVSIKFEEKLRIEIQGQIVTLVIFPMLEYGVVKIGVDAPRAVGVNREEVQNRVIETLNLSLNIA